MPSTWNYIAGRIDWKQQFYDDVQSGKIEYYSNLVPPADEDKQAI